MKKRAIFFGALCAGMLAISSTAYAAPGDQRTLFFDDFETADFRQWIQPVSRNWEVNFGSLTGIYGADVEGPTDGDDALTGKVSTEGYRNIEISYRFKADSLEDDAINNDAVFIQYSSNGGETWNTVYVIRDGEDDHVDGSMTGLYHKFHALPGNAANNPNFMFRFNPDLVGNPDEVWIDAVMITGIKLGSGTIPPQPAPTPP